MQGEEEQTNTFTTRLRPSQVGGGSVGEEEEEEGWKHFVGGGGGETGLDGWRDVWGSRTGRAFEDVGVTR